MKPAQNALAEAVVASAARMWVPDSRRTLSALATGEFPQEGCTKALALDQRMVGPSSMLVVQPLPKEILSTARKKIVAATDRAGYLRTSVTMHELTTLTTILRQIPFSRWK